MDPAAPANKLRLGLEAPPLFPASSTEVSLANRLSCTLLGPGLHCTCSSVSGAVTGARGVGGGVPAAGPGGGPAGAPDGSPLRPRPEHICPAWPAVRRQERSGSVPASRRMFLSGWLLGTATWKARRRTAQGPAGWRRFRARVLADARAREDPLSPARGCSVQEA